MKDMNFFLHDKKYGRMVLATEYYKMSYLLREYVSNAPAGRTAYVVSMCYRFGLSLVAKFISNYVMPRMATREDWSLCIMYGEKHGFIKD